MNILCKILGLADLPTSHTEKIVSALGGFVAILGILIISRWSLDAHASAILVASMGASAVLLFAIPHGPLSQPWPVFGGHIVSAIIGVSCARYIPNEILAASLAVGGAIGAMYYLRCIHPPGGATALSAIIGGEAVLELGYQYVFTPVLLNVIIILSAAMLFNFFFSWRRYPTYWHSQKSKKDNIPNGVPKITHEGFVYALSQIDSFIDVNEQDLLRIYGLAIKGSQGNEIVPAMHQKKKIAYNQ